MAVNLNSKISHKEFSELSSPLALDLTAVFNVMKDEIMNLLNIAEKEGWTPEQLIKKVEDMI